MIRNSKGGHHSMLQHFTPAGQTGLRAHARRTMIVTLALCVMFVSTGCSFFVSKTQSINVSSNPTGATVTVNGNRVGATPLSTDIPRRDSSMITVERDGYDPVTVTTSTGLSGWGIADIVGGVIWLFPFLGLLSSGAWRQQPENINVTLPSS
jgi:hypothetical protein